MNQRAIHRGERGPRGRERRSVRVARWLCGPGRWGVIVWVAAAIWVLGAPDAVAQTRPSAPVSVGRLEDQPIRHSVPGDSSGTSPATSQHSEGFNFPQVVLALGGVIGLILVLRWGGRRLFGPAVSAGPTRAVRVLSRSVVSTKHQIVLVQVGRRVLVLSDSGPQMRTLAEVSDPDEVAELVGQIQQNKDGSSVRSFGSLFGRHVGGYGPDATGGERDAQAAPADLTATVTQTELTEGASSESMGAMRRDVRGLMDKVKVLSRQFQR